MSPSQKIGMLNPRNDRKVPVLSSRLYFLIAEYTPKGMAMIVVTIRAVPINRNVGKIRGPMISLTGAYCLKLTPRSPCKRSPNQMKYWTGIGLSSPYRAVSRSMSSCCTLGRLRSSASGSPERLTRTKMTALAAKSTNTLNRIFLMMYAIILSPSSGQAGRRYDPGCRALARRPKRPYLLQRPLAHVPVRPRQGRVGDDSAQVLDKGGVLRPLVHRKDRQVLGHLLLHLLQQLGALRLIEGDVGVLHPLRRLLVLVPVVVLPLRRDGFRGEQRRQRGVGGREPSPLA